MTKGMSKAFRDVFVLCSCSCVSFLCKMTGKKLANYAK